MGPEIHYLQMEHGTRDILPPRKDIGPGRDLVPEASTCGQNDSQAPVKTLPSRNYCYGCYFNTAIHSELILIVQESNQIT